MSFTYTINKSYYNKTDPNKYHKAIIDTVAEVANRTLDEFRVECPVRTGNLRDSHILSVDGLSASISNSAEYWRFVVYGTIKMAANNYPQRAWNTMVTQNIINTVFEEKLKENGIDTQ